MITAHQAKTIVALTEKLAGLRLVLNAMSSQKAHEGRIQVILKNSDGWSGGKEYAVHLDPVQALGLVRASFQKQANECIRQLNQLGAEVPK